MALIWATKSEEVGLIVRIVSFQDFQRMVLIHQRHRQTERQTTCDRKTALCTIVHRAVKFVTDIKYVSLTLQSI